jgi:prevent-host-death family protein
MRLIGAFAAKNTLGTLLDEVERGEEVVITRHGRPVARLVPTSSRIDQNQVFAAMERIRGRAAQFKGGELTWETLKAERDAGRP